MISEYEATLLSQYFAQIPRHGNVENYPISRDTLEELIDRSGIEDDIGNWIRYFESVGSTSDSQLRLNKDTFLEELLDGFSDSEWLRNNPYYEEVSSNHYKITFPLKIRGDVILNLFTDGTSVDSSDPSLIEKEGTIWTIEPSEQTINQEACYSWRELLEDNFLESLRTDLDEILGPDYLNLCTVQSPAMEKVPESVEDCVSFYSNVLRLDPDTRPNATERAKISNHINSEFIIDYIREKEDIWIILCDCDISREHLHFHLFKDGTPISIDQSNKAENLKERVRTKVKRYNNYSEGKKDIEPAIKTIGAVLAIAGVVELFPIAIMLSIFGIDIDSTSFIAALAVLIVGYILVGVGLLIYMLMPALKFRYHDWEKRGIREWLSDLVD